MPVREMLARAYHGSCLALGRSLRRARYSRATIVVEGGEEKVRKQRALYAPMLVWMGAPLMRMLAAGVRVLPRPEWEERERLMYRRLHGHDIRVDLDGALILPRLGGVSLATLLADAEPGETARQRALELAVVALADLHARGFTHGDAMAENVLVDLGAGAAHWIDFENEHDPTRSMEWRRSDDLRALVTSCIIHTGSDASDDVCRAAVAAYPDKAVCRLLSTTLRAPWRRPLAFHLGQAGLSFQHSREIARVLQVST